MGVQPVDALPRERVAHERLERARYRGGPRVARGLRREVREFVPYE